MPQHMGRSSGVSGGTSDSTGRAFIGSAGGGVGGNCGGPRSAGRYLTAHPSTRCFNGLARPVVLRVHLLK